MMWSYLPGDIAGLSLSSDEGNQESLGSGIVSKVTKGCVCIAFDDSYDTSHLDDGAQYRITKLANDVTFQRMKRWGAFEHFEAWTKWLILKTTFFKYHCNVVL